MAGFLVWILEYSKCQAYPCGFRITPILWHYLDCAIHFHFDCIITSIMKMVGSIMNLVHQLLHKLLLNLFFWMLSMLEKLMNSDIIS